MMELDDFKKQFANELAATNTNNTGTVACTSENWVSNAESLGQEFKKYKRKYAIHIWLETVVAVFAFTATVMLMFFGEQWYPKIIAELLPNLRPNNASGSFEIHWLMTLSVCLMAVYCIVIPLKMHRSKSVERISLNATTTEHIQQQINYFSNLSNFWKTSFLWSILPANIIGVSFFWGLQISLIDTWIPSIYLLGYFLFIAFFNWYSARLKKRLVNEEIHFKLKVLDDLKRSITELSAS